jgi:hypothetical protein
MEWLEAQLDKPSDPPVEEPDMVCMERSPGISLEGSQSRQQASKDVSSDPAVKQSLTLSRSEPSPLSSGSEKKEPSASQWQGLWSNGVPHHTRPAQVAVRDGEISVGDGTAWKEESQRRVDLWRAAAMKNRAFAEMMEERRRMHVPVDQWRTGYKQNGITKELG